MIIIPCWGGYPIDDCINAARRHAVPYRLEAGEDSPWQGLARAGYIKAKAIAHGFNTMDGDCIIQRPPVWPDVHLGMAPQWHGGPIPTCPDGGPELQSGVIICNAPNQKFFDRFMYHMKNACRRLTIPWRDEVAASMAFRDCGGVIIPECFNCSHQASDAEKAAATIVHFHGVLQHGNRL